MTGGTKPHAEGWNMEGPRAPRESEIANVMSFLDSHLRPGEKWSIKDEYPVAFASQNLGNIRIITENDQVLSHAVLRPMLIKSPAGLFKIAEIGSVVTSSDHRNQGLSRQIIESCLEAATQANCEFAILWTNLYDFYRKMGFELAGSEVSLLWDQEIHLPGGALRFMDTPKVSPEAIQRLFMEHTVTSLRSLDETRRYLQIPNMRIYTAWDAQNQLKAYAIEGKGADLNGYVHEWGGKVSALLPLFAHIQKIQGRAITIICPRHAKNLIAQAKKLGVKSNEGFLAMIKLINPTTLFSKIKRYARLTGAGELVLEQRMGEYYIGFGKNIFKTDSEADVIRLVFGPQKPSEIHSFDPDTLSRLEKILPIHMWIWGWDSI